MDDENSPIAAIKIEAKAANRQKNHSPIFDKRATMFLTIDRCYMLAKHNRARTGDLEIGECDI